MGRKPLANTEPNTDAQAMELMARKQEEHELTMKEVDEAYLADGEIYNIHICMEKARLYQNQMGSAMIELGKQIMLIKAHEDHGNFLTCIEELGLAERSARYAMTAARKFGNRQSSAVLGLGNEKIRALTVLDDDSIQSLDSGEEIEGLGTIDDVSKMTVKELRAALRKEKTERVKERESQEKVISAKNDKLNEMEQQLRYQEPPTKEHLAQTALDDLKGKLFQVLSVASYQITRIRDVITEASVIPNVTGEQLEAWAADSNGLQRDLDDGYQALFEEIENICPRRSEGDEACMANGLTE